MMGEETTKSITLNKIKCSKQANRRNNIAQDNKKTEGDSCPFENRTTEPEFADWFLGDALMG